MMKVISTYISAIRLLFLRWRTWLVVFGANLIFALLMIIPFEGVLHEAAAHSDAPLKGLQHFDINFIADVINNFGPELKIWLWQLMIFVFLYLVLNIFLAGGLIESYIHLFQRFSFSQFLSNCAKHFWRLFRLALYFLGAQIVVIILLAFLYTKLGLSPFELDSDQQFINHNRLIFILFVVLFAWMDMVLEYAKVKLVVQNKGGFILPQLVKMKIFVLRHLFPMLLLYLLCAATFLLINWLCAQSRDLVPVSSTGTIFISIMLGQFFIFLRVGARLLFTAAATDYLRSKVWAA